MGYTFDELDIRKIWLSTMSLNARVMRQMEKVGFSLEVRRRKGIYADGVWYEELVYGLFREDWPGRAALIEKSGLAATLGRSGYSPKSLHRGEDFFI
jgi:hypothetical protein